MKMLDFEYETLKIIYFSLMDRGDDDWIYRLYFIQTLLYFVTDPFQSKNYEKYSDMSYREILNSKDFQEYVEKSYYKYLRSEIGNLQAFLEKVEENE